MHEKHPIDDIFRSSLGRAEATPPPAVWEGIVRRRSWGHRTLLLLERRWGWTLVILLLLALPTALITARTQGGHATDGVSAVSERAPVLHEATGVGSTTVGPGTREPDSTANPMNTNGSDMVAETKRGGVGGHQNPRTVTRPQLDERSVSTGSTGANTPLSSLGSEGARSAVDVATAAPSSIAPSRLASIVIELERVPSGPGFGSDHDQGPYRAPYLDDFVIPSGNWFIGVEVGTGALDGAWKGDASWVPDLNASEDPMGQQHVQLLFGRQWNSGVHLAMGFGAARRTSRFLGTSQDAAQVVGSTDTTWSVIPAGTVTYSTWDIDTLQLVEPGVERSYSATNRYTAWRLGVELGRTWQFHRWTAGLDLSAWVHFGERAEGKTFSNTYATTADGSPGAGVVSLDEVDDRKTFSLGGSAAFDLGFLISDRVSLHARPYFQIDLTGGDEVFLEGRTFGAALRFNYMFGSSGR